MADPLPSVQYRLALVYAAFFNAYVNSTMLPPNIKTAEDFSKTDDQPRPRLVIEVLEDGTEGKSKKYVLRCKICVASGPEGEDPIKVAQWATTVDALLRDDLSFYQFVSTVGPTMPAGTFTGWKILKRRLSTAEDTIDPETSEREFVVVLNLTIAVS